MKKRLFVLFVLLTLCMPLFVSTTSFAQNNTEVVVDLKELDDVTRNKIIESMKKQNNLSDIDIKNMKPEDIKSWADAISGVLKTVCDDLNVGVNEFIKTDAGKITTFLIAYKIIGKDIKRIVFSLLWAIVLIPIIITSFIVFHVPVKVKTKDEDGKESITYVQRYKWQTYTYDEPVAKICSVAAHIIMFVGVSITTLVCMVV